MLANRVAYAESVRKGIDWIVRQINEYHDDHIQPSVAAIRSSVDRRQRGFDKPRSVHENRRIDRRGRRGLRICGRGRVGRRVVVFDFDAANFERLFVLHVIATGGTRGKSRSPNA